MTKREYQRLTAKLEKRRDAVGKERDRIRAILDDYEDLAQHCEVAYERLQETIDILSELA